MCVPRAAKRGIGSPWSIRSGSWQALPDVTALYCSQKMTHPIWQSTGCWLWLDHGMSGPRKPCDSSIWHSDHAVHGCIDWFLFVNRTWLWQSRSTCLSWVLVLAVFFNIINAWSAVFMAALVYSVMAERWIRQWTITSFICVVMAWFSAIHKKFN